jgi:hypothetical protein|mmetsp:Transcript_105974/g.167295  ORF Transcript_105974/g.167295 Transcript_105974/m.167295 type:complete len:165 (-) Transcript_105974:162-656(-)
MVHLMYSFRIQVLMRQLDFRDSLASRSTTIRVRSLRSRAVLESAPVSSVFFLACGGQSILRARDPLPAHVGFNAAVGLIRYHAPLIFLWLGSLCAHWKWRKARRDHIARIAIIGLGGSSLRALVLCCVCTEAWHSASFLRVDDSVEIRACRILFSAELMFAIFR